jgi:hypothetical protein
VARPGGREVVNLEKDEGSQAMSAPNDIWGDLGALPEQEHGHVLTKLFTLYENRLLANAADQAALDFFKHLASAIDQTAGCNLNRR